MSKRKAPHATNKRKSEKVGASDLEGYVKALAVVGSTQFAAQHLRRSRGIFLACIYYQKLLVKHCPEDKARKADLAIYLGRVARIAAMRDDTAEAAKLIRQALALVVELDQDVDASGYPVDLKLRLAHALIEAGWTLLHLGDTAVANMLGVGAWGALMEVDASKRGVKPDPELTLTADLSLLLSLGDAGLEYSQRTESMFQRLLDTVQASPTCAQKLLIVVLDQYSSFLRRHGRIEQAKQIERRLRPIREEWSVGEGIDR